MSIQANFNDALYNNDYNHEDFEDCKKVLLKGFVLQTVCDSLDKILCPKPLSHYRLEKQKKCEEHLIEVDTDKLWANIAEKVCRLLICVNDSDSICKLLLEAGIILNDKLQVDKETRCAVQKLIDGNCFLQNVKATVDQKFDVQPGRCPVEGCDEEEPVEEPEPSNNL
jgi:hypothetical protein